VQGSDMVILTVDGHDFYAPWVVEYSGGEVEYIVEQGYEPKATSWDYPDPSKSSVLPDSYDEYYEFYTSGIRSCAIHKGVAYISFVYYGVVDVYVYNIEEKTGQWMSGAKDLAVYYESILADLQRSNEEMFWSTFVFYRNYDIVTISPEHNYALIRRSLSVWGIEGQYIMLNLLTGEETFIIGSYTRNPEYLVSFMEEMFKWIGDDHLLLGVVADTDFGWMVVYDVVYDGQKWLVSESDSSFWD